MFVMCCVGSGLCDGLISRSEESYSVCVCVCLIVCDLETLTVRRPRSELGFLLWRAPQQKLRTHRSLVGLLCNPMRKIMKLFLLFHFNGAPVEWNWQGKTEVLGEKPVPVPLCPPQIPHGLTLDRNRASSVRVRRLTAWAMARPR
jgi:hypothetical protein